MSEPIYVDMWWQPSDGAIAWFKARGFVGILGYFSNGNDGLISNWADATFQRIKAAGLRTGAYCSLRADPATWKARAAALGIPLLLDHETSVDGGASDAAVDGSLARSGASLYGGSDTMTNHHTHGHAGYVLAGYISNSGTPNPIDPGLTWGTTPLPNPARPIGRQFAGGVPTPYGPVDYSHFDPAFFATPVPPKPIIIARGDSMLVRNSATGSVDFYSGGRMLHIATQAQLAAIQAAGFVLIDNNDVWNACQADAALALKQYGGAPPSNLPTALILAGTFTGTAT